MCCKVKKILTSLILQILIGEARGLPSSIAGLSFPPKVLTKMRDRGEEEYW